MQSRPIQSVAEQAAQAFQADTQSTHNTIVQVSAARTIQLLRKNYPDIKTHVLTDKMANPPSSSVDEAQLKRIHQTQASLMGYLDHCITIVSSQLNEPQQKAVFGQWLGFNPSEQEALLASPSVASTLTVIAHLLSDAERTHSEKIAILTELKSIVSACPQIAWDDKATQWAINRYSLDVQDKRTVIASPAETLNLVASAILDEAHYDLSLSALSDETEKIARINALLFACLELHQSEAPGRQLCSGGKQHQLLMLLNKSYHDKPCTMQDSRPIQFFQIPADFLLDALVRYVDHALKEVGEEERHACHLRWLVFNLDLDSQPATHPFFLFMKHQDPEWQNTFEEKLLQEADDCGIKQAIAPTLDIETLIAELSAAGLQSRLPLSQLETAFNEKIPNTHNNEDLITDYRQARSAFHARLIALSLEPTLDIDALKQHAEQFLTAVELLRRIQTYHVTTLFLANHHAFQPAIEAMKVNLKQYFIDLPRYLAGEITCSPLIDPDIKTTFVTQAALFNIENAQAIQLITQSFVMINATILRQDQLKLTEFLQTIRENKAVIALSDEQITQWLQATPDNNTLLLTAYQINRLILHALLCDNGNWSEPTHHALMLITAFLKRPTQDPSEQALQRAYPRTLTENLIFLAKYRLQYQASAAIQTFIQSVIEENNFLSQDHNLLSVQILKKPLLIPVMCHFHELTPADQQIILQSDVLSELIQDGYQLSNLL
ncbi:MAG: hypothetical protein ACD_45C00437G0001, partial [uncultured bacterium]